MSMVSPAGCLPLAQGNEALRKQPEEREAGGSDRKISALLLACCVTLGSLFISLGLCCLYKIRKMGFPSVRAGTVCSV